MQMNKDMDYHVKDSQQNQNCSKERLGSGSVGIVLVGLVGGVWFRELVYPNHQNRKSFQESTEGPPSDPLSTYSGLIVVWEWRGEAKQSFVSTIPREPHKTSRSLTAGTHPRGALRRPEKVGTLDTPFPFPSHKTSTDRGGRHWRLEE